MSKKENIKFKETRRLIQGKYFLGNEIEGKPTYVHVVKVISPDKFEFNDDYDTLSEVVLAEWMEYRINTSWLFGKGRMEHFDYKRISKKEFDNGIKTWGKFKSNDEYLKKKSKWKPLK